MGERQERDEAGLADGTQAAGAISLDEGLDNRDAEKSAACVHGVNCGRPPLLAERAESAETGP
jgi:hypothetical protein